MNARNAHVNGFFVLGNCQELTCRNTEFLGMRPPRSGFSTLGHLSPLVVTGSNLMHCWRYSVGGFNVGLYRTTEDPSTRSPACAGLYLSTIRQILFSPERLYYFRPLRELAEQHRIVAKFDELMALCDRLKAELATVRQRKATLADTLIESALEVT